MKISSAELQRIVAPIVGRDEAEDVAQDVYVKLLETPAAHDGRNGASERTWIGEVAKSVAIDHVRKRRRSPLTDAVSVDDVTAAAPEPPEDRRTDVAWCLDRLSPEDRPLVERYLQSGSFARASQALGMSKWAFMRKWHRIVAELRSQP